MPGYGDTSDTADRAVAARLGVDLSEEEFAQLAGIDPDFGAFTALEAAVRDGAVTLRAAAVRGVSTWQRKPDNQTVDYTLWRTMFRLIGFTVEGKPARRPRRSVLLFRGARATAAAGLSWTRDLEQASYFARYRQEPGSEAFVWVAVVEPERMLAIPTIGRGTEAEVVVDATDMPVIRLNAAAVERLMADHGGQFTRQRRRALRWALRVRQLRQRYRTEAADYPPSRSD